MQAEPHIRTYTSVPWVERSTAGLGVAIIGGASAMIALFDPTSHSFFPICPLYAMTGFACPGCGLTRGFHAFFHGEVVTALDFNALIPIWAAVFGYVWISLLLYTVRGRGLPMWPTSPAFLWTFMIALLVFGVIRNIPISPFTILSP